MTVGLGFLMTMGRQAKRLLLCNIARRNQSVYLSGNCPYSMKIGGSFNIQSNQWLMWIKRRCLMRMKGLSCLEAFGFFNFTAGFRFSM